MCLRISILLGAPPLPLPSFFPLNTHSSLVARIRLHQCGYMLPIKIFSSFFAMIHLYSLSIMALQVPLKAYFRISVEFVSEIWEWLQLLDSGSGSFLKAWLWLEDPHARWLTHNCWGKAPVPHWQTGVLSSSPHGALCRAAWALPWSVQGRASMAETTRSFRTPPQKSDSITSTIAWPLSMWEGTGKDMYYTIMQILLEARCHNREECVLSLSDLKIRKHREIKLICLKW